MHASALATLGQNFLARPQQLYINGKWQAAAAGATFDTFNPATGEVLAQVASGDAMDVDLAVRAARAAFEAGAWPRMRPAERARLLLKLAALLEANADELALIETLNNGKPFMAARHFDVAAAIECLRYNAGWVTKIGGETHEISMPGDWHAFTLREPVGVVGQIVPWNVPLTMAVGKIAPALAAGCTVVLKPAEQTPLTAIRLFQLIEEAGFPPGVANLVTGLGKQAGAALADHPDVDKIAFTGSTAVGKSILAASTGNLKRVALELGGKSPVIVFADADLDKAAEGIARGIFFNAGQVCAAGSRLFVERSVFDRVVAGVAEHAKRLRVGSGLLPETEIGPVISRLQQDRILGYIEGARKDGADILTGGGAIGDTGYFVQPTVLANVRPDMRAVREEIFGPVLCAMPFDGDDLDGVIRQANDTDYGLSSYVWTQNLGRAHRVAKRIRAGNVRVNAAAAPDFSLPFGGFKQSGWGRENGKEGVEMYTELKAVVMAI